MQGDLRGWLKEKMAEQRLGRNELSRLAGVPTGTISRITLYNHVPGVDAIHKLADFFGVDRDTLLEIAGVVQLSDLPDDMVAEVRDLARRLFRLPESDRRAILAQFDGILKLLENRSSD